MEYLRHQSFIDPREGCGASIVLVVGLVSTDREQAGSTESFDLWGGHTYLDDAASATIPGG